MASLTKRYIKGRPYYYAVESKRINGKPRLVWQKYLGTAEEIIQTITRPCLPLPIKGKTFNYGGISALFSIAKKLHLIETINKVVRKRSQGLSTGEYITLAAINRCVCPKSKRQIGKWYRKTILSRLIPASKKELTSQRFWDNMSYISQEHIDQIEKELTQILIEDFGVDLRCLIYDPTNFFTYINTFNEKNKLAQHGRNKQKRNDLRQVNLGLLVSRDFHIPLLHKVYEGNVNDSVQFRPVTEELIERYKLLSKNCKDITIIYDKGNNSETNQEHIDKSEYHYVGSLTPSWHLDLLEIPTSNYQNLRGEEFREGEKAYRTKKNVFNKEQTIVIAFNPELFLNQTKTLCSQIKKKTGRLKLLKNKIRRRYLLDKRGKQLSLKLIKKHIEQILTGSHMKELIEVKVFKEQGEFRLSYQVNKKAKEELINKQFGKTILFTDNHDWTNEEIVSAYRAQYKIESAFKQMKDPYFVSWYPMFHWTDQKIRVHAFYCVLALMLVSLLQRELYKKNILMDINAVIESLNEIEEIMIIYASNEQTKTSFKKQFILSELDETQKLLFHALELEQFQIT